MGGSNARNKIITWAVSFVFCPDKHVRQDVRHVAESHGKETYFNSSKPMLDRPHGLQIRIFSEIINLRKNFIITSKS